PCGSPTTSCAGGPIVTAVVSCPHPLTVKAIAMSPADVRPSVTARRTRERRLHSEPRPLGIDQPPPSDASPLQVTDREKGASRPDPPRGSHATPLLGCLSICTTTESRVVARSEGRRVGEESGG